ncbi:MAG TPA: hypothetical protein VF654_04490 [Pyrinomonadaceae bacterium]|jgi:hypothetical protein
MSEVNRNEPSPLERLDVITKRLAGGDAAAAAANPTEQPAPESKDASAAADARLEQTSRVGLARGLERLARASKNFRHLGADRVLDDPRAFLRQKNAAGAFVVQDHELEVMMQTLLAQKASDDVTPVSDEVRTGFLSAASKGAFGARSEVLSRALDTGGSGATLIRTDLDPFLWESYLRTFPVAERFARVPANGLKHTYEVRTAIPDGSTTNDIGDFSGNFSNSTFVREESTRIAIIVSPVAIGLKLALAVQQSGMGFNLQGSDNLEVMGAMRGIARKKQTLLCQGNSSTAAQTLDDEDGLYVATDHDGLRTLLKGGSTSLTKDDAQSYRRTLRRVSAQIRNAGGEARNIIVLVSEGVAIVIDEELEEFYRITNGRPGGGVDTNLSANGIRLGSDVLSEIVPVPADAQNRGLGHYTFGGNPTEDMYVLDATGVRIPYLGSPTPSILELPMGFDLKLARTFVPFEMSGLMVHVKGFHRKVRVPKQTV